MDAHSYAPGVSRPHLSGRATSDAAARRAPKLKNLLRHATSGPSIGVSTSARGVVATSLFRFAGRMASVCPRHDEVRVAALTRSATARPRAFTADADDSARRVFESAACAAQLLKRGVDTSEQRRHNARGVRVRRTPRGVAGSFSEVAAEVVELFSASCWDGSRVASRSMSAASCGRSPVALGSSVQIPPTEPPG